jgi:hypothetical protein
VSQAINSLRRVTTPEEYVAGALRRGRSRSYEKASLPQVPGLYAIYARDKDIWKELGLTRTNTSGLLYVGKAEDSLRSRLGDHYDFNGNSTFRVAMIAVLREVLGLGEVCPRFETRYDRATRFGKRPRYSDFRLVAAEDEEALTEWLSTNTSVAWLEGAEVPRRGNRLPLEHFEVRLMLKWRPLLNLRDNWSGGNAAVVNARRKALTAQARQWYAKALGTSPTPLDVKAAARTTGRPVARSSSMPSRSSRKHSPAIPVSGGLGQVKANLQELRKKARQAYTRYGADPQGWSLKEYLSAVDELEAAIDVAAKVKPTTRDRWEAEKRARNKAQPLYYRGRVRIATGGLGFYKSKVGDKGVEWNSTELSEAANTLAAGPLVTIYRTTAKAAGIS